MAKNREQRYRNPDGLILDLECLLAREPPRLARQQIQATTLEALTEGEAEEDEEKFAATSHTSWPWLAILAVLLGLSALVNLLLLLRH